MVYIIEFNPPMFHARFYVGYCADNRVQQRFKQHLTGQGAHITRAAVQRGIQLRIIATLPGFREEERRIKARKNTPRYVEQLKRQGVIA
jgi:predicted GIY-YIG superfamily endonuclease